MAYSPVIHAKPVILCTKVTVVSASAYTALLYSISSRKIAQTFLHLVIAYNPEWVSNEWSRWVFMV
jgi:hypothetical protein